MGLDLIPAKILKRFGVEERRHACAILSHDFPDEFADIIGCLEQFELVRSEVEAGGGGKTKIAARFDNYLRDKRGWMPRNTSIAMKLTTKHGTKTEVTERNLDTHEVDLCKGKIAVEVQWNNKDPFFSRDLNTFRLLHELGSISVGIIVTRSDELQDLFKELGWVKDRNEGWQRVAAKYGASTTHWSKLMPRVEAGGDGACPLLLVGIRRACYRDDLPRVRLVLTKSNE
jgi:hypothetical protein